MENLLKIDFRTVRGILKLNNRTRFIDNIEIVSRAKGPVVVIFGTKTMEISGASKKEILDYFNKK